MQNDQHALQTAMLSISSLMAAGPVGIHIDYLPHIPTMIATRLQLEVLLQEPSINLSAVSEVILSDVGATLLIFRLISEEYLSEEEHPTRIEDCLASLSIERWHSAICASNETPAAEVVIQWQYARRVAQCARELAKCVEGLAPEEAYLIGLLHEVGKLPRLLGWNSFSGSIAEEEMLGIMLADYWHLPNYLLSAIHEQQLQRHKNEVYSSRWNEILQMSRQIATHAENLPLGMMFYSTHLEEAN